jgi:hypothetical protein
MQLLNNNTGKKDLKYYYEMSKINKNKKLNIKFSVVSLWLERWFWSSNAKDIGVLYLIFALLSGLIATGFSVLIRLELSAPGIQFIADNQLYNSIITAHAIIMIFFMVKSKIYMSNLEPKPLSTHKTVINNDFDISVRNDDNNNYETNKNFKHEYVKVFIKDPYSNRDIILKITKRQKGVYVWGTLHNKNVYVYHTINLYNRISSYFMPSILNTKARRVLRYLNKHSFDNINLTVYIMEIKSDLSQIIALEHYLIDTLKPNLNVDLVASSSGYHELMGQEIREKFRKLRERPIYVYEAKSLCLLYIFESKQHMYNMVNINNKTLNDCLDLGTLYLDHFFLSLDAGAALESMNVKLLTMDVMKNLVKTKRDLHITKHLAAKAILAEFKDDAGCAAAAPASKNLEIWHIKGMAG